MHRFLHTLEATFGIYWGKNRKILLMPQFEHKLSNYHISKFVLKYNINLGKYFHPICFWCMLLWITPNQYVKINGSIYTIEEFVTMLKLISINKQCRNSFVQS